MTESPKYAQMRVDKGSCQGYNSIEGWRKGEVPPIALFKEKKGAHYDLQCQTQPRAEEDERG